MYLQMGGLCDFGGDAAGRSRSDGCTRLVPLGGLDPPIAVIMRRARARALLMAICETRGVLRLETRVRARAGMAIHGFGGGFPGSPAESRI